MDQSSQSYGHEEIILTSTPPTPFMTVDCEMQNSNESVVPLLEVMSKCNVE